MKNGSERESYRRRLENLERIEREAKEAPKVKPTSTTNTTTNQQKEPKYTFYKDESTKTSGQNSKSSQQQKQQRKASFQQTPGASSKPGAQTFNFQGRRFTFFHSRPTSSSFNRYYDTNSDDSDDGIDASNAFFSSRDFFKTAFGADTGGAKEKLFEEMFKAAFGKQPNASSKAKPSATKSKAKDSKSRSTFNSDDSDDDIDELLNRNRRKGSFFYSDEKPSKVNNPFATRFSMGAFDDEDDEDVFPKNRPFGQKPHGKFASKTRKNEEGFISFNDENPSLLLHCQYCNQKIPADKWSVHEKGCNGFATPNTGTNDGNFRGRAAAQQSARQRAASIGRSSGRPGWNSNFTTATGNEPPLHDSTKSAKNRQTGGSFKGKAATGNIRFAKTFGFE